MFWNGTDKFWITGYDHERKPDGVDTMCPQCGFLIEKKSKVAVIRWRPPPSDAWTIMHPNCAETSPCNIRNKQDVVENKNSRFEIVKDLRREDAMAVVNDRSAKGLFTSVRIDRSKPQGKQWIVKTPVKKVER